MKKIFSKLIEDFLRLARSDPSSTKRWNVAMDSNWISGACKYHFDLRRPFFLLYFLNLILLVNSGSVAPHFGGNEHGFIPIRRRSACVL